MAARTILQTDTLETFRTQFNDLAAIDFGDIANLNSAISATNLVDAMNENRMKNNFPLYIKRVLEINRRYSELLKVEMCF